MKSPDITGFASRAWRVRGGDDKAGIGAWLVDAPSSHPWWNWHVIASVHLRETPWDPTPFKRAPDATHEIIVMALDPNTYPPDPDGGPGSFRYLSPADICEQFAGLTDHLMRELLDLGVKAVCDGRLIPDQDHRSAWRTSLDETFSHMRAGQHGRLWPAEARRITDGGA